MSYTPKNPNGQDTMADSSPVVIASDQSAVPVDLGVNNDVTVTSGAITETNSAAIKTAVELIDNAVSGAGFNITQIGGAAAPIGAGLEATAVRVTLPTDGTGKVGLIAGTANIGDVDIASIAAGDNNIGNVDIVSGTITTVSTVTSLTQMNGQAISMGTGVRDAGTQRVTIATNDAVPVTFTGSTDVATQTTLASALTSLQTLDNAISGNEMQVDVVGALPAGTNAIGKLAANSGVDIGDVDVTSTVTPVPTTSGGCLVANFNTGDTYTALTNSAQVIKASAGQLYGYYIYNPNATATYVLLYNIAAASVTVGTSTAQMVFCIPATAGANLDLTHGIAFTNAGWSIAATTTGGGNSAPSTALEAMIWYK